MQVVCMQVGHTDLANQLHNLVEVILLLQHLTHSLPDVDEVRVKLVVEWLQRLHHHTAGQQTVAFRCQISKCIDACIKYVLLEWLQRLQHQIGGEQTVAASFWNRVTPGWCAYIHPLNTHVHVHVHVYVYVYVYVYAYVYVYVYGYMYVYLYLYAYVHT